MLTNADAAPEVAAADQEEPPEARATANAKLMLHVQERPLDARAATRQDTVRLPNRMVLLTNVSATG